jgi:hypothetical protein
VNALQKAATTKDSEIQDSRPNWMRLLLHRRWWSQRRSMTWKRSATRSRMALNDRN